MFFPWFLLFIVVICLFSCACFMLEHSLDRSLFLMHFFSTHMFPCNLLFFVIFFFELDLDYLVQSTDRVLFLLFFIFIYIYFQLSPVLWRCCLRSFKTLFGYLINTLLAVSLLPITFITHLKLLYKLLF